MKQYVLNAEPSLIKEVDRIIKTQKLYSSRNEFVRDAIRSKVSECSALGVRQKFREIAENALKKGWSGEMPTRAKRAKIADEYLKELGLSRK